MKLKKQKIRREITGVSKRRGKKMNKIENKTGGSTAPDPGICTSG